MMHLLDLTLTLFNWLLVLTLIRLVSTAFGWEFGVSRQYLRLLERLLQEGQARIEKVESEHRLMEENEVGSDDLALISGSNSARGNMETSRHEDGIGALKPPNSLELNNQTRQRKVCILNGHSELSYALSWGKNGFEVAGDKSEVEMVPSTTLANGQEQKRRRVSTPDGPPVFLLDEYDSDDEEDMPISENIEKTANMINGDRNCMHQIAPHQPHKHEFHLEDAARFVIKGVEAVIDDEVTKRFTPEELKTWNLLTRTNAKNYQFMSRSLGICWLLGVLIRYTILLPLRIMFTLAGSIWLIGSMTIIGLTPRAWRSRPYKLVSLMSFRMLSCGITSRLKFHNRQYRAKQGDICVANHTSPLDVVLLACDNCYALVGQRHGGLLGLLEVALSRATNHVWFDRTEMRDRQLVTRRLKEHVSVKRNLPVLIFPEGTCINNSAVMMFRKGSFETTNRVCPVAIKYDARFGDPFWDSSQQSYLQYLLMMMSSWAIKCDVWYLPPMERQPGETSAEFANRVKAEIAKQGGLVDLAWDGQLKRSSVKPTWLFQQQEDYVKRLKLE